MAWLDLVVFFRQLPYLVNSFPINYFFYKLVDTIDKATDSLCGSNIMSPTASLQLCALDIAGEDSGALSRLANNNQGKLTKEELEGNTIRYPDRRLQLPDIAGLRSEEAKPGSYLQPAPGPRQIIRGKTVEGALIRIVLVEDEEGVKVRSEQRCGGINSFNEVKHLRDVARPVH